ncbi:MAG: NUDIX hydrolase [Deltaproteobacteria bacterium]|nr:NUDIX hydrolase [Deltaproteobacteria bacterium]
MLVEKICPRCGYVAREHRNPVPAVDIIIEYQNRGVVLIQRGKPPWGWALPGGFVEYGEPLEEAARREAREETGLEVDLLGQFHAYSDPRRDPRQHTVTVVFVARGYGTPQAADDARDLAIFSPENPPESLAFDHARILADYVKVRRQWLLRREPGEL